MRECPLAAEYSEEQSAKVIWDGVARVERMNAERLFGRDFLGTLSHENRRDESTVS